VTRDAIHRSTFLPVAIETETHRVIDLALGDRLLPHVGVANRTIHAGANVRRVIKFHMSRRFESVDSLPRNVFAARAVGRKLLDFRLVRRDHLVASHAEINAGDPRIRPLIDTDVAVGALHPVAEVHFVRVRDRLDGLRAQAKKLADRIGNGRMGRCENV